MDLKQNLLIQRVTFCFDWSVEEAKQNKRMLDRAKRQVDRERKKLDPLEKKYLAEIKDLAKKGKHVI